MFPRVGDDDLTERISNMCILLIYVPRFGTKRGMLGLKGSVNYSDRGKHRTC